MTPKQTPKQGAASARPAENPRSAGRDHRHVAHPPPLRATARCDIDALHDGDLVAESDTNLASIGYHFGAKAALLDPGHMPTGDQLLSGLAEVFAASFPRPGVSGSSRH